MSHYEGQIHDKVRQLGELLDLESVDALVPGEIALFAPATTTQYEVRYPVIDVLLAIARRLPK
ncbi:MAG TPA: hypothetical protein VHO25_14525 [Polyangiaceae bacterium]|nr:hypothetical protein [Polyangiaceae bacterium]